MTDKEHQALFIAIRNGLATMFCPLCGRSGVKLVWSERTQPHALDTVLDTHAMLIVGTTFATDQSHVTANRGRIATVTVKCPASGQPVTEVP